MSTKQLEDQIEKVRLRMYQLYAKSPHDPIVVEVSQELDELLNQLKEITSHADKDMKK